MKRLFLYSIALALAAYSIDPAAAAKPGDAKARFDLQDGDLVVFLGGTFIERAQKFGYVEAILTARYPDRNIRFRNLGWSADTVWAESRGIFDPPAKGYQRMLEHVGRLKPTVIVLAYGANEAYAGKPGLERFLKQYKKLVGDLRGAVKKPPRFLFMLPPPHESLGPPLPNAAPYNKKLAVYQAGIQKLADELQIPVVKPFYDEPNAVGIVTGTRAIDGLAKGLTSNGLHFTAKGYMTIGRFLDVQLGGLSNNYSYSPLISFDSNGKPLAGTKAGFKKLKVRKTKRGFSFTAERSSLSDPAIYFFLQKLQPGTYTLTIDGKKVRTAKSNEWQDDLTAGPDWEQFEKLRAAVIEKNELYFHRWRPQNVTYLFGFRKHEQGQNAKEVVEFDKLVAAKEAEIAKLRKPVAHKYELELTEDAK